ncbi:MAG TPA: type II toxin-antitoxin system PemK/MazF family toxin [Candidatus Nanoarchaeia archaeon]|nr:type II toxin-antitoxin system PemK/MazF family toxin [Candidatus Nanoarchaeia archaeon]
MKKGEVWLVELPSTNGHEQSGTRPVLILTDTQTTTAVIIPFTSTPLAIRFPHTLEVPSTTKNGLSIASVLLIFQIRAIDKKRLKKKVGELEAETLEEVDKMLKTMLLL